MTVHAKARGCDSFHEYFINVLTDLWINSIDEKLDFMRSQKSQMVKSQNLAG